MPLFDYELLLYRALLVQGYLNSIASLHSNDPNNVAHSFKVKLLWFKKATGKTLLKITRQGEGKETSYNVEAAD